MKTAVSIPDDVFDSAEQLAKRLSISRSELYARALKDMLMRQQAAAITEQINAACDEIDTSLDTRLAAAQRRVLTSEKW